MSPKELKSLMARTRTSSPMLAEALGIAEQQIRKWRAGTRPVPERHISVMRRLFSDRAASLGVEPRSLPEIPERVDPREIAAAPIEHRVTIEARDEPLPPANGPAVIDAINSAVALLTGRRPALQRPVAPPAAPAKAAMVRALDRETILPPAVPVRARPLPPAVIIPAQQQQRRPPIINAVPLGPPTVPFAMPRGPRCQWPQSMPPGAPSGPCEQLAAPGAAYCALHLVQHMQGRER